MTKRTLTTAVSRKSQALRAIVLSSLALPFIAAPTPGNIGGCGGSYVATPVTPAAGTPQTAEEAFFEQGLCAHFCRRLLDCNQLCVAMTNPPAGCGTDSMATQIAYYDCVHATTPVLNPSIFGFTSCPHACPLGKRFAYAPDNRTPLVYQWDVQVCGDAVLALSCGGDSVSGGTIAAAFTLPPTECVHQAICR
jgi:hypothetical protein